MRKSLIHVLVISGVLLLPAVWGADKSSPQQPTADQAKEAQEDRGDKGFAQAYCVSQTGTHLLRRDGGCLDNVSGQTVTRYEWEQKGGVSASDYLRNSVP